MPTPQEVIEKAKRDYAEAQKRGDKAAMDAAHKTAEQARRSAGISNDDPVYGNDPKTYRGSSAADREPRSKYSVDAPTIGFDLSKGPIKTGDDPRYAWGANELYRTGGGMVHWNPNLQLEADNRGVNLSLHTRGGDVFSTLDSTSRFLDSRGVGKLNLAKRSLNPFEMYQRLSDEAAGRASRDDFDSWYNRTYRQPLGLPDWSPEFADSYLRQRQQQQQLLQVQDSLSRMQMRDPWEGMMEQVMPYLLQMFGFGGMFGGYSPYGYGYDPYGYGYSPYYGYPYF